VLDQRNLTFSPRVLAVRVGTTVDSPNRDRVFLAAYVLAVDSGYFAVSDSRRQRPTVRSMKSTISLDTLVSGVPTDSSCDE
jgi:hypothetical protein